MVKGNKYLSTISTINCFQLMQIPTSLKTTSLNLNNNLFHSLFDLGNFFLLFACYPNDLLKILRPAFMPCTSNEGGVSVSTKNKFLI